MSGMSNSTGGGHNGAELMVEQFHYKVLHAVLVVRTTCPLAAATPAAASFWRRDRCFHLPLHDPPQPPEAADRLEPLAPGEPLVVGVLLSPAGGGAVVGAGAEVVERWMVACEPRPDAAVGEEVAVNRAYKHCFTLLRHLFCCSSE